MSATLETIARDREILLMRSALCRLRLRRDAYALREALHWKRAVAAPAARGVAFGLVASFVGLARTARLLALAGRLVVIAKVARVVIDYARHRAGVRGNLEGPRASSEGNVRYRTDGAGNSP